MEVKVMGRVRKLLESLDSASPGADEQVALNDQLEQLIAVGAAPYSEIVRAGRAFKIGTAAAIGAVVAVPTTAVMFALYNNEEDGGKSMIIDWVAASNVVSTAVASQAQLLGLIGQVREAAPTDAALAIVKMNGMGQGTPDSSARSILNATALPATTGIAANWMPLGPSVGKPGAAGTPGYGLWADVGGRIIVPPGRYFGVHVLANVVGETFLAYVGWHEKQLRLG